MAASRAERAEVAVAVGWAARLEGEGRAEVGGERGEAVEVEATATVAAAAAAAVREDGDILVEVGLEAEVAMGMGEVAVAEV